ncbi:hypothetical protein [Flavobacterium sp.]|uniref:hypothetical protein n=1 Tax=Flavobacterium sp. TaxID=239 RepID=UPI0022C85514|nr:hypothetical protein [Flavobacterium sp.]MCZ8091307.1 hypothetical protein [Flavobacterium sp.]
MNTNKIILFALLLLIFNSCVTGIYKIAKGYESYVETNVNGREELKKKKFKNKFKKDMSEKIVIDKVYYNFYQDSTINLQYHTYIRLFKTGQFAVFSSINNNINIDNISQARNVGYYIVENEILKLEKPAGNFRTGNYKIIRKYIIGKNSLKEHGRESKHIFKKEFKVVENIEINNKIKPDW